MLLPSSAHRVLGQVFARDGLLGRVRGSRRQLRSLRAAASLRASESRFRALFDAAPVAIAITRGGVLLYVNEAAVTLLGCGDKSEMIGQTVETFVAPPQREVMQRRIERRAQGLEEPLIYQSEARRGDGTVMPLHIEVTQLELPDGVATLAFAFDLRAEHAAQAQRNTLLQRARRAALFAERLQGITSALAASHSGASVAELIVARGAAALDARAGALSVPVTGPVTGPVAANGAFDLEIVAAQGYASQLISDYARLPISPQSPFPAVRAFLEGRPLWLENQAQIEREFPAFAAILPATRDQAACVLPLEFENRLLGVLNFSFAAEQEFDAETRAFMLTLAAQCAAALERARLLGEAQGAARLQRESLALLDTLLDTAPVGFAFFDLQGRYVLVNHALARINRASVAAHLGRTISDIMPSVGARLEAMIGRVVENGEPSGEIEILGVPVGGGEAILHALIAFYPVRGAGNGLTTGAGTGAKSEILGVGSVVIDISARVDAERDRVQLMGELEIERARFETILQQMPSGVMIAEAPSCRLILGNSQNAEIWRHASPGAPEAENYELYRGFHFDGRELDAAEWPLVRAIKGGETVRGEEVMIRRGDGTSGVVRLNAAPIRDRDGAVTAGVVIVDDVTDRSKSEAAQRFLAEAGSALVASLDERECYEQLARLCVPNVADWCLIAVPDEDGLLSQISVAQAGAQVGDISSEEAETLVKDFKVALQNDPQLPWELGGLLRDSLSEASGEGSKPSADIAPDELSPGLVSGGSESVPEGAAERDLPADAFNGALRSAGVVLTPGSIGKLLDLSSSASYRRFIAQIGAKSAIITPLQAREQVLGLMVWISASSNRHYAEGDLELADEIGRRAALAAANARLFREAELARDEAQNANRAKDEFLAVVSHELRTPLTPILGWLELLRSPDAGEEIRAQAYDVIERNARAQAQLINDILDVSRITTGKLRLELKPLALREVVARAAEMLRPSAREKNIELQLHLDGNAACAPDKEPGEVVAPGENENRVQLAEPRAMSALSDRKDNRAADQSKEILALADSNRLQQIVWNLLQNALKFTPSGGVVKVCLGQDLEAEIAILEVVDNGAGIDAEFLPHVFDRFRQADSSSTRRAGGLGLGLAIVDHIVEGHGGKVSASSEGSGRGATFRVELPLFSAPQNSSEISANAPDISHAASPIPSSVAASSVAASSVAASSVAASPFSTSPASASSALLTPLSGQMPRHDLQGLSIWVVDDEPDTRAVLQAVLEKSGARVTVAARGADALAQWEIFPLDARPALLICDIAMPGMDGHELRRALQSLGFTAPSIALSAYTEALDVQKALDAGFDFHLAKPVDAENLLATVARLSGQVRR